MLQRESVVAAFLARCHAKIRMPRGSQAASLLYALCCGTVMATLGCQLDGILNQLNYHLQDQIN